MLNIEEVLHFLEEMVDGGIFPLVLMEVMRDGLAEIVFLHEGEELLHGGRTFHVGDAVEDRIGDAGVDDLASDGMRGNHLVRNVASPFELKEGGHGRLVVDGLEGTLQLLEAKEGNECGEGLVEPEVVPPLHGHQVAKPVVRQLMSDDAGKHEHLLCRNLFSEEQRVVEGDHSCIFHGAPSVLMREHLVVFVEGEGVIEKLLVKFHRLNGELEDERRQIFKRLV
jgi:hypothetical protein